MKDLKIKDKRILSIQDLSCFGKCSTSVAIPIISALGIEIDVLPTAILSTHTGGFDNPVYIDLTKHILEIKNHWKKEGIFFDALYSGYLGKKEHISYVIDIMDDLLYANSFKIIDPVMADHGKLYKGFDLSYVEEIKKLCKKADFILPNLTEACFLTGIEYKETYDIGYINKIIDELSKLTKANIILKGIRLSKDKIRVFIKKDNLIDFIETEYIDKACHGTGDIFACILVANIVKNNDLKETIKIAMNFIIESLKSTLDDEAHWYGVKFEKQLAKLILN